MRSQMMLSAVEAPSMENNLQVWRTIHTQRQSRKNQMNIEKDDPVPYEPVVGEILGEGPTSRIARVAPGVIIKYPRFSWWKSKTVADKWFARDMKRSFEVEERLLQILGLHPRIIESVSP